MSFEDDDVVDDGLLTIEEMLASGDPDLIALANAQLAENGTPAPTESAENTDATQSVESVDNTNDSQMPPSDVETPVTTSPENHTRVDGVYTKDEKNIMPFSVVEDSRRETKEVKTQLQSVLDEKGELESQLTKLQRQLDLAAQQGITLPTLPEDEQISDEDLKELEDISPEFARVARQTRYLRGQLEETNKRASDLQASAPPQSPSGQPDSSSEVSNEFLEAQAAVSRNPAIQEILSRPDMKGVAISIEQSLMNEPQYANSLDARYAEVAKRVGGAFGIDFGQKYGAKTVTAYQSAPGSQPPTPESMSDMPNADLPQPGITAAEVYAGKSDAQLHDDLGNMSAEQIENLVQGL